MRSEDIRRLNEIEKEVKKEAEEMGLTTTEIMFKLVSSRRMIEAMAYQFPTNFSHWSFGRDYDRIRTIYEHRGAGIPYETVWNFDPPKAFLVETNPVALNILIIAHVYGHVDFFLENRFLKKSIEVIDSGNQARAAEKRFKRHEREYGKEPYERTIEAAFSLRGQQLPDLMVDRANDEVIRKRMIKMKKKRLRSLKRREFNQNNKKEVKELEKELKELRHKKPPVPRYDILAYILENSPKPLKNWQQDVVSTIAQQSKFFEFQKRTKMLNEGWACYVHVHIMRRLYKRGLISQKEHQQFSRFHSGVTRKIKSKLNWYNIGLSFYEDLLYRWNRGMHGRDFKESKDPFKFSKWNKEENKGIEKIFEVRKNYTDRMAVEQFFDEEFIKDEEIYIWKQRKNPNTGEIEYVIVEDDPRKIKQILMKNFSLYATPVVKVVNGNYNGNRELYLKHEFTGFELNPQYESGALENIYYLWGKPVHLETVELIRDKQGNVKEKKTILHSYDGNEHTIT